MFPKDVQLSWKPAKLDKKAKKPKTNASASEQQAVLSIDPLIVTSASEEVKQALQPIPKVEAPLPCLVLEEEYKAAPGELSLKMLESIKPKGITSENISYHEASMICARAVVDYYN